MWRSYARRLVRAAFPPPPEQQQKQKLQQHHANAAAANLLPLLLRVAREQFRVDGGSLECFLHGIRHRLEACWDARLQVPVSLFFVDACRLAQPGKAMPNAVFDEISATICSEWGDRIAQVIGEHIPVASTDIFQSTLRCYLQLVQPSGDHSAGSILVQCVRDEVGDRWKEEFAEPVRKAYFTFEKMNREDLEQLWDFLTRPTPTITSSGGSCLQTCWKQILSLCLWVFDFVMPEPWTFSQTKAELAQRRALVFDTLVQPLELIGYSAPVQEDLSLASVSLDVICSIIMLGFSVHESLRRFSQKNIEPLFLFDPVAGAEGLLCTFFSVARDGAVFSYALGKELLDLTSECIEKLHDYIFANHDCTASESSSKNSWVLMTIFGPLVTAIAILWELVHTVKTTPLSELVPVVLAALKQTVSVICRKSSEWRGAIQDRLGHLGGCVLSFDDEGRLNIDASFLETLHWKNRST